MNTPKPCPNARDLAWITDPDGWPAWPLCPMKRPAPSEPLGQCAVLVAPREPEGPFVLYEQLLFLFVAGPLAPQLVGLPSFPYATAAELLADGWTVD